MAPFVVAVSAAAHPMPRPQVELYFAKRCGQGSVRACIHRASIHWNQSYLQMLRVATCESRLNPRARNTQGSGATGLFQFMPGTWASTPYGRYSIWSAKYQSLATGWMWNAGRKSEWSCQA